jgi:hypothetical protein
MNERIGYGVQIGVPMNRGNSISQVRQSYLNCTNGEHDMTNGATGAISSSNVSTQPHQQQKMESTPTITVSQSQIQLNQFSCPVLHQRPPRTSSSQEASLVDMFVNQNSILWKRIEGYERRCYDLNQTKKDLQE